MRHKKLMVLERLSKTEDGFGDDTPERWIFVREVWVMLKNWAPRGSAELIDALQVKEQNTHWGRMRYVDEIDSSMRLTYKGRVFAITSVQYVNEGNRFIDLRLIERVG